MVENCRVLIWLAVILKKEKKRELLFDFWEFWLLRYPHGQRDCVGQNECKDQIFKVMRSDQPPHFVLKPSFGNIPTYGSSFERKLNTIPLILVQFTIFVLLFAFVLKCNNHKANKNVDHEEGDHNNVDDVEYGHIGPVVVNWPIIFGMRID